MAEELHWDHPERIARATAAMRDPNPHLRRDSYTGARLAREVEGIQRSEILGTPTNFLPPEQRTTTTTPAGERAYKIADPRPEARLDTNTERLNRAAFFREVGYGQQLSGTHETQANTRHFNAPAFVPVKRLDAAGRVEEVDWSQAHKQPDG